MQPQASSGFGEPTVPTVPTGFGDGAAVEAPTTESQDYYGAPESSENITLGERLRGYYQEDDFVTVMNVDTRPLKYQFSAPGSIETYSAYPGHKETTMKKPPQVVTLQPGETKLVPAYEADLMIENLIKQMSVRSVADRISAGELSGDKAANWSDPTFQTATIKSAFRGKRDLIKNYNEQNEQQEAKVEGDLDVRKPGRPRKAV